MSAPNVPGIAYVAEAAGMVVVAATQAPITGTEPVVAYRLYRSLFQGGPWGSAIDTRLIDRITVRTKLFDAAPLYGIGIWYAVTAVDSAGLESAVSGPFAFDAFNDQPLPGQSGKISAAALGDYPWLGSDVFLDPVSGEAVVGPNGDMLSINGLACLAQDLFIRLRTTKGELPMHPDFGLTVSIGSGQAAPQVEAQIMATDVTDELLLDERVQRVLSVKITQYDQFSWIVGYDVMAIGVPTVTSLAGIIGFQ